MDKNRKKLYEEYFDNEEMKSIMIDIIKIDYKHIQLKELSCVKKF